ncbi:hypothetical protein C8R47DRAFT_122972 [Mycena vitilis]|nr:hypothetical protein C8R47DRAFT_122972 [Mycena vitilis]
MNVALIRCPHHETSGASSFTIKDSMATTEKLVSGQFSTPLNPPSVQPRLPLPTELYDHIIDHLHDNKRALWRAVWSVQPGARRADTICFKMPAPSISTPIIFTDSASCSPPKESTRTSGACIWKARSSKSTATRFPTQPRPRPHRESSGVEISAAQLPPRPNPALVCPYPHAELPCDYGSRVHVDAILLFAVYRDRGFATPATPRLNIPGVLARL